MDSVVNPEAVVRLWECNAHYRCRIRRSCFSPFKQRVLMWRRRPQNSAKSDRDNQPTCELEFIHTNKAPSSLPASAIELGQSLSTMSGLPQSGFNKATYQNFVFFLNEWAFLLPPV